MPRLPLIVMTLLATVSAAQAAPATLGVHSQPKVAGLQPVTFSFTTPSFPLAGKLDLAARFDTSVAFGESAPAPAPSTLLVTQPRNPWRFLGTHFTPYLGGGIGAITFSGGAQALTWVVRGGVNVALPGTPVGLNVEGQATRAGYGWSAGLTLTLPQETK